MIIQKINFRKTDGRIKKKKKDFFVISISSPTNKNISMYKFLTNILFLSLSLSLSIYIYIYIYTIYNPSAICKYIEN